MEGYKFILRNERPRLERSAWGQQNEQGSERQGPASASGLSFHSLLVLACASSQHFSDLAACAQSSPEALVMSECGTAGLGGTESLHV